MAILWVEDEQHLLGAELLEERWKIDTAIACDVAIAKLKAQTYELLIVDLIVPVTTGARADLEFEVDHRDDLEEKYGGLWLIRYVREVLDPNVPIMVVTIVVGDDRDPIERRLDGIISDYLSKYDTKPDDWCKRIEELLQ